MSGEMVKRVGVVGGGQLAWMMGDAAHKLGLELGIQTPKADDPAVAIATHTILAAVADANATEQLAAWGDVITFENEFVDLPALSPLAQQGVRFYPPLTSLAPLLDKYDQRQLLQTLHIPTPQFVAVHHPDQFIAANPLGFPLVLKARRHGYDGRGTEVISTARELEQFWAAGSAVTATEWIAEAFVPFERELAVMAARSLTGEVAVYPVVETQQIDQVCRRVLVWEDWEPAVVDQVRSIAVQLLHHLNYVGVLGIEFFLTQDGTVLVNELAPRTHNSGHYTLEACQTSQFEQQLRAVSGLPLGEVALKSAGAVMVNLLGFETAQQEYQEQRQRLAQIPHATVYWYGKTQSRPGRKLGHVTVLLPAKADRSQVLEIVAAIESVWYPDLS